VKLPSAKTVIEPFRIKSVEPMPILEAPKRKQLIKDASYNLFLLPASAVTFDLLTDSGTSAMSARQWGAMMVGDESYAGSSSYLKFEKTVQDLTGLEHVIPTHQGRSAEALLMTAMIKPGETVIGNTHFDTTRANIENAGAKALDLPSPSIALGIDDDFKGNIDLTKLQEHLKNETNKVRAIIITITNNSVGGQPVSMENIRNANELAKSYNIPLFLDCARFAENAYFIKIRENGYSDRSIPSICKEMFSYCDGAIMSAKKDAFANIGGFLAINNLEIASQIRSLMVLTEGFPTYGGLAGRDMEALAVGLKEIQEEDYLSYRIRSVEYFGKGIEAAGLKVVTPIGGHAVYIDAGKTLPHIPSSQFPGQSLSVALYEHIGIRSVEVGSVMLGHRDPETGKEHPAPQELVRLAMPRRVYTQSHVDYMVEMIHYLAPHLAELRGFEFSYQARFLRHFTAKFKKLT